MENKMYVVDKPYREMELRLIDKYGEKWAKIYKELKANGYDVTYDSVKYYGKTRFISKNERHGGEYSRLYRIWHQMKERCYQKSCKIYKYYGGEGKIVCDEWKNSFIVFRNWAYTNGYKDNLTLERIDNNGNYEPSNCCWATRKRQANNRRTNRYITFQGETHTMAEWSDITGIPQHIIESRLNKLKWSVDDVLTTLVNSPKNKIMYNGEEKDIAELAKQHGLKYEQVKGRLKKGWDIEKALNTPIRKWRKRDINVL
jgi:hypothetical protein